jgi:ribose transport system permease protein
MLDQHANKVGVTVSVASSRVGPSMSTGTTETRLLLAAERYGLVVLLTATIMVFSLIPESAPTFATRANLNNILGGEVTLCVVAIAFTLPLMVGQLDLSVASIAGLASVAATSAMSWYDAPLPVAIAVALVIGSLVGAINGYLIAIVGLDSIIVTLAGMTLIEGVVQWYTKGLSINTGISSTLTNFGSLQWLTIPRVTYLLAIVAALSWYLIEKTPFGRYIRMIGSNRAAARLVGLPVQRLMFLIFALTGVLAGVAGVLLTARSGGANPLDGPGLLLPALAAVYLGATTIQPGRFNIIGTILGVFFVAIAVSGLTLCGVPPFVEQLFDGGALLLAVGLSRGLGWVRGGGGSIGT